MRIPDRRVTPNAVAGVHFTLQLSQSHCIWTSPLFLSTSRDASLKLLVSWRFILRNQSKTLFFSNGLRVELLKPVLQWPEVIIRDKRHWRDTESPAAL